MLLHVEFARALLVALDLVRSELVILRALELDFLRDKPLLAVDRLDRGLVLVTLFLMLLWGELLTRERERLK